MFLYIFVSLQSLHDFCKGALKGMDVELHTNQKLEKHFKYILMVTVLCIPVKVTIRYKMCQLVQLVNVARA